MNKLNENEKKVLDVISSGDEWDERPTRVAEDIYDLVDELSVNQIKGYLSQLEQKGLIIECELPGDVKAWQEL